MKTINAGNIYISSDNNPHVGTDPEMFICIDDQSASLDVRCCDDYYTSSFEVYDFHAHYMNYYKQAHPVKYTQFTKLL